MKRLENVLIDSKPACCDECMGRVYFVWDGRYKCKTCGKHLLDALGKIKEYRRENMFAGVEEIAQATNVEEEDVYVILSREGMELPKDSKYYLSCEKCGCSLQTGRFCAVCIRELAGGIGNLIQEERRGRRTLDMTGTMHIRSRW